MRTLERATPRSRSGRRLLVVDQFEELFTLCRDEAERAAFVAAIVARRRGRRRRRAWPCARTSTRRCAAYPALARLLAANHVLVGPLQRAELRRAIELPSQRAGLRVEPELVDRLLADVELEPGALPLLSTALFELWERRDGRLLSLAGYERSGGVRGAVARLAETAYARLDPAQQADRAAHPAAAGR